jgi:hypothetical protein
MNTRVKRWISGILVFCLVPWMTGCESLTGQLWSEGFEAGHHQVAPEPNLKVSQTADRKDVLVQYDEVRDKATKIQHRAYLLYANEETIEAGRKPQFVNTAETRKMQLIPLTISYTTNADAAYSLDLQVVLRADRHHFVLVSAGKVTGPYQLPDYIQPGTWFLVLMTPVAVTGDAIYDASLLALFVFAAAYSGGSLPGGSRPPP